MLNEGQSLGQNDSARQGKTADSRADRSEITSQRVAPGVDSRAAIGPRRGLLDLSGQPQQQIFATVRGDELNTDREALGRQV